jgi:hypothetical protein
MNTYSFPSCSPKDINGTTFCYVRVLVDIGDVQNPKK